MSILNSIKKTIEYEQQYNCKLNTSEIKERLISNKIYRDKEINEFIKSSGYKIVDFKSKQKLTKIKKAKELVKLLGKSFKDILMIGITGSVAAGYPKRDDDIDLMIITKKNKLWWTRLKLRYFIYRNSIPHRKYGQKENKDDFCFNLWLDEDCLLLPIKRQNLRNAMDLILMKPLLNREQAYEKFIMVNNWAKKWVATGYNEKISNFQFLISKKNRKGKITGKIINFLVFWPQFWYMKKRIKKEKIGLHEAFFHN